MFFLKSLSKNLKNGKTKNEIKNVLRLQEKNPLITLTSGRFDKAYISFIVGARMCNINIRAGITNHDCNQILTVVLFFTLYYYNTDSIFKMCIKYLIRI